MKRQGYILLIYLLTLPGLLVLLGGTALGKGLKQGTYDIFLSSYLLVRAICVACFLLALSVAANATDADCIRMRPGWFGTETSVNSYGSYSAQQVTFYNDCSKFLSVSICIQTPTSKQYTEGYECAIHTAQGGKAIFSPTIVLGVDWYISTCPADAPDCIEKLRQLNECTDRGSDCIDSVRSNW